MKLFLLILAILCLWLKLAMGVINNGLLVWQPNGAISYSVWKRPQGSATYQFLGSTSNNVFSVPTALPGDYLYIKSKHLDNGICCTESDYAFAIAQPHAEGTNELRWIPSIEGLVIQTTYGPMKEWSNMVIFEGTAIRMQMDKQAALKTWRTNLPPRFP